jgi:ubiquinone/menaquinone biosynthesis C-methylase UbiE
MITTLDWQRRFDQQARWTAQVRSYLFTLANTKPTDRILETGCGPGAILRDYSDNSYIDLHGIDIRLDFLSLAKKKLPDTRLACANVYDLPYQDGLFDVCFCHYFLLGVNSTNALLEMRRVTRSGGYILAFAEPDYGGRIDFPPELVKLGVKQAQALSQQGADSQIGRKLAALFRQAGLVNVIIGVTGGFWEQPPSTDDLALEWLVLKADLDQIISEQELASLEEIDRQAWKKGERILYIPTFYALGRVP